MNSYQYPTAPTWRQCHPVNIYVYRNGIGTDKPQLVHIPMEKKRNMSTVLEAIGSRMKIPVGYPVALYNMDGSRVCKTYELEMYNNYVVVTNLEKRFKCVDYGCLRDPLVVIGISDSKHVKTLTFQNKPYDLFRRKKMARKPLHELISHGQDGLGPEDIPSGVPCGPLCHKIMPRNRATLCCSDEIMCVEGAAMDIEPDTCRNIPNCLQFNCPTADLPTLELSESQMEQLAEAMRQADCNTAGAGQTSTSANLGDLIDRYKEAGSDIFKMFQDKITRDLDQSNISSRWNIPTTISSTTEQKVNDELVKISQQPCEFTFDQFGNFIGSSTCKVGPPAGGFITSPEMGSLPALFDLGAAEVKEEEVANIIRIEESEVVLPPEGWLAAPPPPPSKSPSNMGSKEDTGTGAQNSKTSIDELNANPNAPTTTLQTIEEEEDVETEGEEEAELALQTVENLDLERRYELEDIGEDTDANGEGDDEYLDD